MNQKTLLEATDAMLTVELRATKKSLKTVVIHQVGDEKSVGCTNHFAYEQEAEAQKSYDALVADAVKKGWTVALAKSTFTEIPAPPKGKAEVAELRTAAASLADHTVSSRKAKK
jgi:Na+-transporting NADH:ubiquinone oxidoreductase subunit NqrA